MQHTKLRDISTYFSIPNMTLLPRVRGHYPLHHARAHFSVFGGAVTNAARTAFRLWSVHEIIVVEPECYRIRDQCSLNTDTQHSIQNPRHALNE